MNMKTRNALLLLVVLLGLSGCLMTREGFMAKLNSNDPKERKWAEDVVLRGSTNSELGTKENLKWVEFATTNDLLFRIFEQSWDGDVVSLVASKIDFSKEGAKEKFEECLFQAKSEGYYILQRNGGYRKCERTYRKFEFVEDIRNYLQYLSIDVLEDKDFRYLTGIRDAALEWHIGRKLTDMTVFLKKFKGCGRPFPLVAGFVENMGIDKMEGEECLRYLLSIDDNGVNICNILAGYKKIKLLNQYKGKKYEAYIKKEGGECANFCGFENWHLPSWNEMRSSDYSSLYADLLKWKEASLTAIEQLPPGKKRKEARAKFDNQYKVQESKVEAIYKEAEKVADKEGRAAISLLTAKLSDEARFEVVTNNIHGIHYSHEPLVYSALFQQTMIIALAIKDEAIREKTYCEILCNEPLEQGAEKYWILYSSKLKEKITAEGIERILIAVPKYYAYLEDRVTPDVAISVLQSKKLRSRDVEIELCKKVPSNKITLELISCVQSTQGGKILKDAMPAELKEANASSTKARFDEIMKKAEVAAQSTFMLAGFYLGMNQDDMKAVLKHYFPDDEIALKEKGEEKEFYVSSQKTVFAVTDKNGKVCQFTFGEDMLKKWYKYDVQNYEEWIHAYEKAHNARFVFKLRKLNNDRFRFRQDSYQYTNNAKKYTLIYFGDRELETLPSFNSGSGDMFAGLGDVFSAEQVNDYKRDPGSLRVFDTKE